MRVLVCSDVHANLEALEAVLAHAGEVDAVWCLGDTVGYGPDPEACVERMRGLPGVCLMGNHDSAALGQLDIDSFNSEARRAILWTRSILKPENREWLETRPQRVGPLEERYTLTHGSPRYPIWEYILDSSTAEENFEHFDTSVCFFGHSHVPGLFIGKERHAYWVPASEIHSLLELGDEKLLINPGSVGQPRDGDPDASYLILDTNTGTVAFQRVAYPWEETQAKMAAQNLPSRLIARLAYGW